MAQLAATFLIAVISLLVSGNIVAYSVLLGGLISALPNTYFVMHAFRYRGARSADKVVKSFAKGEFGKMSITLVLFALCFSLITNISELALILGFIAAHFIGVVMSGFMKFNPSSNNP